ncbi:hypothetical protein ACEOBI_25185 [Escherichia coli]|uniref:hypothetical protein n=1 Tax=Escherichia coli TaxID=562 RepID=UPI003570B791
MDTFHFQRMKEAFHAGIIVAALCAHTATQIAGRRDQRHSSVSSLSAEAREMMAKKMTPAQRRQHYND